ncbi:pilus assembly PilX N-terminal domain-containing protein [Ureibacillus sp. MALMAid1270]|uniref:pilus assembly PilX N-terminal domain-containing protein n=1 Tax=Ureibacillus sp. MALMAid1270 TaxID=3411629 RepID=UPI003BA64C8A
MKHLKNQHGYGMFIAVMLILLVTTIGISLLTLTLNTNKTAANERKDQSTFYFAEAGINLEKANLLNVFKKIDQEIINEFNGLDYDSQVNLLNKYSNDFSIYYTSQMNQRFCSNFNLLYHSSDTPNKCNTNKYTSSFQLGEQFGKQPVVDTSVQFACLVDCVVEISSKGYFEDSPGQSRTVSQKLLINANPKLTEGNPGSGGESSSGGGDPIEALENYAAIISNDIYINSIVTGNVATLNGKISIDGGPSINGLLAASNLSKLIYPNWMNGIKEKYTPLPSFHTTNLVDFLPEFPDFQIKDGISTPLHQNVVSNGKTIIENGILNLPDDTSFTLPLTKDTRFHSIKIYNNRLLTIEVGNKNINLYVENLDLTNGDIKINGTGTVNIYVKNKFTIASQSYFDIGNNQVNMYVKDFDIKQGMINFGSAAKFNAYVTESINVKGYINQNGSPAASNIYYKGTDEVTFGNETQIYSSIYNKTSHFKLLNGAGIYGNFYTGGNNVTLNGGVKSNGHWFVAPNADLTVTSGGYLKGTVVAKSLKVINGGSLIYGSPIVPNPAIPTPTPPTPFVAITNSNLVVEEPLVEVD